MSSRAIPYCAAEITAEWLTEVLAEGGHIGGGRVVGIERQTIGEGVGFLGELTRLSLRYEGAPAAAPASLVSKIPTVFEPARSIGKAFGFFERESNFYREVAPKVNLRVPRCYYNVVDAAADRYLLLLEDIRTAAVGDQLAGCSLAQARTVMRAVARFHAQWWDSPELERFAWMPKMSDPVNDYIEPLYRASWTPFLAFQGPEYPRERMSEIFAGAADAQQAARDRLGRGPLSIVHTDFRLDNMFFGGPGSDVPFAVIDWQLTLRSLPLLDVAYFMSQSLPVELRRAHEEELLREYHGVLGECGVRGYSFERCFEDYRLGTMVMFVIPVTGAANLDVSNPRAVPLLRAMAERSTAAILDLRAWEAIEA